MTEMEQRRSAKFWREGRWG